jgi:hypothetical protein
MTENTNGVRADRALLIRRRIGHVRSLQSGSGAHCTPDVEWRPHPGQKLSSANPLTSAVMVVFCNPISHTISKS